MEKNLQAETYKCPNCGASIKFDIEKQKLECEYCKSSFTLEEVEKKELKEKPVASLDTAVMYHCGSCGAKIVTDENTISTFCPYCHSPSILQTKLIGEYKPDKIIPFQIDKSEVTRLFTEWTKTVAFLPDILSTKECLEKISGLYAPFYLLDINSQFDFSGEAQNVKSWMSGNTRYTQTESYRVVRRGSLLYDAIPIDASRALDDMTMRSLEPFDYTKLEEFDMAYLSGYYAEKYDIDQAALFDGIKPTIDSLTRNQTSQLFSRYSGYHLQTEDVKISQKDANYIFLPVWFLNVKYNNKDYIFTMNGQTGKIVGTLPLDKVKKRKYIFTRASIAFAITSVLMLMAGVFGK